MKLTSLVANPAVRLATSLPSFAKVTPLERRRKEKEC